MHQRADAGRLAKRAPQPAYSATSAYAPRRAAATMASDRSRRRADVGRRCERACVRVRDGKSILRLQ